MWGVVRGLAVLAVTLPFAQGVCSDITFISYTTGWCYREFTNIVTYEEGQRECELSPNGRLIDPSRIQHMSSTAALLGLTEGLARTSGRWDPEKAMWYDGSLPHVRLFLLDFGNYSIPDKCETKDPKRKTLVYDVTRDEFVSYDDDAQLPFICEVPNA